MLSKSLEIARAYHVIDPNNPTKENSFYLQYGAIALPYLEQEEAYARFEGHPLGLKLRIETNETHKVEQAGLIERTAASLLSGFAAGVDVDTIRSGKRVVAGMRGDEQVLRMSDKDGVMLSFAWNFQGEKDSGDKPEILISMEAGDGQREEKLRIWDAILDSFKPVGR